MALSCDYGYAIPCAGCCVYLRVGDPDISHCACQRVPLRVSLALCMRMAAPLSCALVVHARCCPPSSHWECTGIHLIPTASACGCASILHCSCILMRLILIRIVSACCCASISHCRCVLTRPIGTVRACCCASTLHCRRIFVRRIRTIGASGRFSKSYVEENFHKSK